MTDAGDGNRISTALCFVEYSTGTISILVRDFLIERVQARVVVRTRASSSSSNNDSYWRDSRAITLESIIDLFTQDHGLLF